MNENKKLDISDLLSICNVSMNVIREYFDHAGSIDNVDYKKAKNILNQSLNKINNILEKE